ARWGHCPIWRRLGVRASAPRTSTLLLARRAPRTTPWLAGGAPVRHDAPAAARKRAVEVVRCTPEESGRTPRRSAGAARRWGSRVGAENALMPRAGRPSSPWGPAPVPPARVAAEAAGRGRVSSKDFG